MRPSAIALLASSFAVAAALTGAAATRAQPSPNGPEFQINTYTTDTQSRPSVAVDGPGGFVVAWASSGSGGTDTSSFSIQARRYAGNGTPLGVQFQVNTYTNSTQFAPALAIGGQGNFVVAWQSLGSGGADTSSYSIQAQRYAANGTVLGPQFQVNTYTNSYQTFPSVAVGGQGNFVVAWQSYGSGGTDTSQYSIQAQRYAANGTPLGSEFQVNTYTTGRQRHPSVAVDSQGNFVVAWESEGSSGTDTSSDSIQAQRFAADGTALGPQFQVNSYTTNGQRDPSVAVDGQGNFVVAWDSNGTSGTDTSSYSIQARRFAANGVPLGAQFQVNTYTSGTQSLPSVAVDNQGNFVVAWHSDGSGGTDTSGGSIQARRFAANGVPLGSDFQVNTYTTSQQRFPKVAVDGQGNVLFAWESSGSSGTDTSSFSIQARRYDQLFRDGFETGNTARWSATAP